MYKIIYIILSISLVCPQGFGYTSTRIITYPDSAKISVNRSYKGISPIVLSVQDGLHATKNNVCAEKEGYKMKCITLDQDWNVPIATTGACFSLFFFPAIVMVLFSAKHKPSYVIHLSAID